MIEVVDVRRVRELDWGGDCKGGWMGVGWGCRGVLGGNFRGGGFKGKGGVLGGNFGELVEGGKGEEEGG